MNDLERRLVDGSRACGTDADITTERELFMKPYPDSEVTLRIEQLQMEMGIE